MRYPQIFRRLTVGQQGPRGLGCHNYDLQAANEKRFLQLSELEELRNEAYDNARIYKDKTKK